MDNYTKTPMPKMLTAKESPFQDLIQSFVSMLKEVPTVDRHAIMRNVREQLMDHSQISIKEMQSDIENLSRQIHELQSFAESIQLWKRKNATLYTLAPEHPAKRWATKHPTLFAVDAATMQRTAFAVFRKRLRINRKYLYLVHRIVRFGLRHLLFK